MASKNTKTAGKSTAKKPKRGASKTSAKLKPKKPLGKTALKKKAVSGAKKTASAKKPLTLREKQLQEIKKKLILQKESLLAEAETMMNNLPEQTIYPDLGDQASVEIDRNFMLRLRGREQKLLKKIDSAIERIENENFGTCEVCGEEIGIKRLLARPVTTMCIACKTEQEEEEKLKGA